MTSLKNVLLINAISSGATGIGLIIMGRLMANLFGVAQPQAFWGVGIFLVAFAILVFTEGIQAVPRINRVRFIIVLDSLWVAASLIIIALQLFNLSTLGYILITAVAAWVGLMAFLQTRGVRNLSV